MTPEQRAKKEKFVAKQFREAKFQEGKTTQEVTCSCGLCAPLRFMYRCLYCGEFYCLKCGEIHFGKTREAHLREQDRGVKEHD